jgi:hypothetical protein
LVTTSRYTTERKDHNPAKIRKLICDGDAARVSTLYQWATASGQLQTTQEDTALAAVPSQNKEISYHSRIDPEPAATIGPAQLAGGE